MDALTPMRKGGDTLLVHPSCVSAHQRSGWAVCPLGDGAPATTQAAEAPETPKAPRARKERAPLQQQPETSQE